MDILLFWLSCLALVALFAAASMRWGVDSRRGLADDHRR